MHVCSHPSLPLFHSSLECSMTEKVDFLLCAALPGHTCIHVMGNQYLKKRQNVDVDNCAEHHPSSAKTLKAVWYRHTHTWRMSSTGIVLQTYSIFLCVVGTHCCTLLWHPSSILNQILWGVCSKQLYFCSMNKLTSPQICSSQLQYAMYKSMPWWAREGAVIFTLFPS